MAPVAIVLWVTSSGGSIAFGGCSAPCMGCRPRWPSRSGAPHGPPRPDRGASSGRCAQLGPPGVPSLAGPYGGPGLATAIVVAAGLTTPALEAGLRALWPSVLPDHRLRHAALALDTGTQGLLYIAGPLLVAALASAYNPSVALAVTAGLGLTGTAVVAIAPPSRLWRPTPSTQSHATTAHRLASPGLLLLFVSLAGVGFAIGAMNVWAVAMARQHEQELLSGILPAAFSTGSFLGGLLYGRRRWRGTATDRLIGGGTFSWPVGSRSLLSGPVRGHRRGRRARCVPDRRGRVRLRDHRLPDARGPYQRGVRVADPVDRRWAVRRHRAGRTPRRAAPHHRSAPCRWGGLRARRPSRRASTPRTHRMPEPPRPARRPPGGRHKTP